MMVVILCASGLNVMLQRHLNKRSSFIVLFVLIIKVIHGFKELS